jgi:hypothetical protein
MRGMGIYGRGRSDAKLFWKKGLEVVEKMQWGGSIRHGKVVGGVKGSAEFFVLLEELHHFGNAPSAVMERGRKHGIKKLENRLHHEDAFVGKPVVFEEHMKGIPYECHQVVHPIPRKRRDIMHRSSFPYDPGSTHINEPDIPHRRNLLDHHLLTSRPPARYGIGISDPGYNHDIPRIEIQVHESTPVLGTVKKKSRLGEYRDQGAKQRGRVGPWRLDPLLHGTTLNEFGHQDRQGLGIPIIPIIRIILYILIIIIILFRFSFP